jgi:hypothetical protein
MSPEHSHRDSAGGGGRNKFHAAYQMCPSEHIAAPAQIITAFIHTPPTLHTSILIEACALQKVRWERRKQFCHEKFIFEVTIVVCIVHNIVYAAVWCCERFRETCSHNLQNSSPVDGSNIFPRNVYNHLQTIRRHNTADTFITENTSNLTQICNLL